MEAQLALYAHFFLKFETIAYWDGSMIAILHYETIQHGINKLSLM